MGSTPDVLILGGGVAGLTAAAHLGRAGLQVELLEARERFGGRIYTSLAAGTPGPVELGAEFVHGRSREIWDIIDRHGLRVGPVVERHLVQQDGVLREDHALWDQIQVLLGKLEEQREPDRSVADFLAAEAGRVPFSLLTTIRNYIEGFHAADPAFLSERSLARSERSGAAGGDQTFRLIDGYSALVAALIEDLQGLPVQMLTSCPVTRITWSRHRVELTIGAEPAAIRTASQVILTLPLGVLQETPGKGAGVDFVPVLAAKRRPLSQLRMGPVERVSIQYREPWWPEATAFVHRPEDEDFQVFWTAQDHRVALLTAWAGGPRAGRLGAHDGSRLAERAHASAARAFGCDAGETGRLIVGAHRHGWSTDRYSCGGYSYAAVGGSTAFEELGEPVEDTLFLAGEATAQDGTNGTVQGAIASGVRAAQQMLNGG